MALALRSVELNQFIDRLAPDLRSLVGDCDKAKYPAHACQLLVEASKDFFNSLHSAWPSRDDAPTRSNLDKALMAFGQGLKMRSRGKTPAGVTNGQRLLL